MRKYIYKGQEYTSVLDLMGPTGISRRALKQLIEDSFKDAKGDIIIDDVIDKYLNDGYEYRGKVYKSISQLYEATGVNRRALNKLIEEHFSGVEGKKVLDDIIDAYIKDRDSVYMYHGKSYKSLRDAAEDLGLNILSLIKYMSMADGDMEKAMELFENSDVIAVLDGIKYTNQADIAKALGVNVLTLRKYIDREGSVEAAYEVIKNREQKEYIWNGEKYTSLSAVARAMGMQAPTLRRIMNAETNGDIELAYKLYQERSSGKYYGYTIDGKQYRSINEIIKAYGISSAKFYELLKENEHDVEKTIHELIAIKEDKARKHEEADQARAEKESSRLRLVYKGETYRSVSDLGRKLGIAETTLHRVIQGIEKKGEVIVDDIIDQYLDSIKTYTYFGKTYSTIVDLAKETGINPNRLARLIRQCDGNAEKAIMIIKTRDSMKKKITIDGTELDIADIATILGVKQAVLKSYIDRGMSIAEIKEHISKEDSFQSKRAPKSDTLMYDSQTSLIEYCVKNRINYRCVYYAITEYGKSIPEAIEYYRTHGQELPTRWVYERYDVLLKHLLLNEGIDYQRVLAVMKKKQIPLKEALEYIVVRDDANENDLYPEWQHEIYSVYTEADLPEEERQEFVKEFYITEREIDVINKSKEKVDDINRKLLLYEMAECIRDQEFSDEEMAELMKSYDVTDQELKTIFYDFYIKFQNGILRTDNQQQYAEMDVRLKKSAKDKIDKYNELMYGVKSNEEQSDPNAGDAER